MEPVRHWNAFPNACTHEKARAGGRDLRFVNTMSTEVSTEASIRPSQVIGSLVVGVGIFLVHKIDQLITLDLSIGTQIPIVNQPLAQFRVVPAFPGSTLSREVVVPDEFLELLPLDLSIRLDDIVLNLRGMLV
jgi:hypothetical protein